MSNKQNKSPTVFEAIDHEMREAIVKLNQKLIHLQTEITAKIAALKSSEDPQHSIQKKQLSILENEVKRALISIDEVVNMAVSKELTHGEFLKLHHDELEKFREMVATNTDKITKINEKI